MPILRGQLLYLHLFNHQPWHTDVKKIRCPLPSEWLRRWPTITNICITKGLHVCSDQMFTFAFCFSLYASTLLAMAGRYSSIPVATGKWQRRAVRTCKSALQVRPGHKKALNLPSHPPTQLSNVSNSVCLVRLSLYLLTISVIFLHTVHHTTPPTIHLRNLLASSFCMNSHLLSYKS